MALYGDGSFTVIVLRRAPSAPARPTPPATALPGIAVPSGGKRVLRYMAVSCGCDGDSVHPTCARHRAWRHPTPPTTRRRPGDSPQPTATGREGSEDHSLHEPGYSAAPDNPAISIASRLWQAVTPE